MFSEVIFKNYIAGLLLFHKEVSGIPIFKVLVRSGEPSQVTMNSQKTAGWSGGAMVLSKFPLTIWITVGQAPTALTVGAGGGGLDIFSLIYPFFPLSSSLWETARYRLKYCLKGP